MWELFLKRDNSILCFGLFSTECLDEAKRLLGAAYPDGYVYAEEKEYDVLHFYADGIKHTVDFKDPGQDVSL